ncbi:MAG: amino acid permease [Acidobacteriota bacterium]
MHESDDERYLRSLGYAQQLFREMGGFSNFAISFSIISILTGAVLLYGYGLKFAGPIVNSVGWPLVSVFTLAVAASMAEIASAYPTAGGLYYWAQRLGGRGWAWVTAWLNMIGQVTITAGINIAAAIYIIGATTSIFGLAPRPLYTTWLFQVGVMVVIMIPQVLINIYGIRVTALLNDISVWWHIGGVVAITLLLTFFGRHHNEPAFLFSFLPSAEPSSTMVAGQYSSGSLLFRILPSLEHLYRAAPPMLLFVLALLQAQWTYTGYDASAHVAEETKMARLNSAWGIFLSVAVSAVVGYVMLMVLTWCIPNGDVARTAADPYPVLYIVASNLPRAMANTIAVIIGGAMWLCGAASITSMARMWYAFARDDGMPGASLLKRVSGKRHTPVWAIVVTSVLAVLVCLYAAAFSVVTSISTIALYLAYVIPIFLNFRNRLPRELTPWNLGRFAPAVNLIAIVWCVFIALVFVLPPNELVLWTMVGLGLLMTVYWFGWQRSRSRTTLLS